MDNSDSTLTKLLWEYYEAVTGPIEEKQLERALKLALWEARTRGLERWPGFRQYLPELYTRYATIAGAEPGASETVRRLVADDLLLAIAALEKNQDALRHLDGAIRTALKPLAQKYFGRNPDRGEELTQRIVINVLLGPEGKPPKLANYGATGSLIGWVRMVARNYFIDHIEPTLTTNSDASDFDRLPDVIDDPDIRLLLAKYNAEVKRSIAEGMAKLSNAERALLTLSLAQGLSIDAIAAIRGGHRATAARGIQQAKKNLVLETQRAFCSATGIGAEEFASIMSALSGRFDSSMVRLLGGDQSDDDSSESH